MIECCLQCNLLGECKTATLEMLLRSRGCGSFVVAPSHVVNARVRARLVAGRRALQQMLKKNPPKAKARKATRRKHA